jgi:succinate dehydrogenase/fumarate reductase iron-sulfur protein
MTKLRVQVKRSDESCQSAFEVERTEPMMVLDVLLAIQRQVDPSLGFRYSCRVAMCGTCTLRLDGRTVLACQTPVPTDTDDIRLAPIAGLPVVRDLIVDTAPFWEQWAQVTPYLVPREDLTEPAVVPPDSAERQLIDPSLDCIGCAACFSSCGIADSGRTFLGPAALNRAMTLIADSRDSAGEQRMNAVGGRSGVDSCHYMYGCTSVCPKGLDPAGSIRQLRNWRLHGRP